MSECVSQAVLAVAVRVALTACGFTLGGGGIECQSGVVMFLLAWDGCIVYLSTWSDVCVCVCSYGDRCVSAWGGCAWWLYVWPW